MKQPFIVGALKLFGALFRYMEHQSAVELGGRLGEMVALLSRRRVNQASARCSRVLGISEEAARGIVLSSYRHFGMGLAEVIRFPVMRDAIPGLVEFEGLENLDRALALGRGAIILSCHMGNWELTAAALALKGYPIRVVAADQRDQRVTDMLVSMRASCGVVTIGKASDLKGVFKCLEEGGALAVLLDQDAKSKGLVSDFLGLPASTPLGPVKLARKLGCPVVPCRSVRDAFNPRMHRVALMSSLEGPDGQPFGEDEAGSLGVCNRLLSSWIREVPDQWIWMYDRWASTMGRNWWTVP
ncbi:Lauroyl/myristoyl acyltransferase [Thermanaerovibrio velox DSM 12556]|uniref:Lauroyl/myristoyl acyltransferase n=1 Tax=Thermanaerovibrio velox DSM 12556 TaxID=926567 RepID=H0UPH6_9BACT|nr:lysophospholipid acyltransferase family protein [Thermanaerovibrio velox]EHM10607.1 Lauroyl/myristoyl acyltransferase [Thermanaerovibrio velox DSM 12556]